MRLISTIVLFLTLFCFQLFAEELIVNSAGDRIYLRNKNMEFVFSNTQTYKMYGMKYDSKQMLPDGGIDTHPWEITYKGSAGENPVLKPNNGYYKGVATRINDDKSTTLIFTWEMLLVADKTHAVRMLLTLGEESDLAEWDIEADLPEEWIVANLNFPRISVTRPQNAKAILSAG